MDSTDKRNGAVRGYTSGLFAGSFFLILSGCAQPSVVETVPVDAVLTELKKQLGQIAPEEDLTPGVPVECSDPDHSVRVIASPIKATVDLKTVVTTVLEASGSANIPAGPSGVIVSPSIGGSHSNINTVDTTIILGIAHRPLTRADYRAHITALRNDLTDRAKTLKDLSALKDPQSRDAAATVQQQITTVQKRLHSDEMQLIPLDAAAPTPEPEPHPVAQSKLPNPQAGRLPEDLNISTAFNSALKGILNVSHEAPCLLPQEVDIKVNFEVITKLQGGLNVSFLVAKIGGDASRQDDGTNSVTVTFDLSNGTVAPKGSSSSGAGNG